VPSHPVDLTPEQTALIQERMRLAREARIQQLQQTQPNASRPSLNLFTMQNGIPNQQTNGFNPFHGNAGMMNGMPSSSSTAQNQNFGAGNE